MHLLLLVCWREWRETGKGDLGAWSGTMIGHLGGSQIIGVWIMQLVCSMSGVPSWILQLVYSMLGMPAWMLQMMWPMLVWWRFDAA